MYMKRERERKTAGAAGEQDNAVSCERGEGKGCVHVCTCYRPILYNIRLYSRPPAYFTVIAIAHLSFRDPRTARRGL